MSGKKLWLNGMLVLGVAISLATSVRFRRNPS